MNDLQTILKQSDIIFQRISEHSMKPDLLLEDASRLSTLLWNLGDHYIEARQDANKIELDLDLKFNEHFLKYRREDKVSEATAKVMSTLDVRDLKIKHLDADQLATMLYIKRKDIENKVSVLQSYASQLRSLITKQNI